MAGSQVPAASCPLPGKSPRKGLEQSRPLGGAGPATWRPQQAQHLAGGARTGGCSEVRQGPSGGSVKVDGGEGLPAGLCGDTHPPQGAPRPSTVPQGLLCWYPWCCPSPRIRRAEGRPRGLLGEASPVNTGPLASYRPTRRQDRTRPGSVGDGRKRPRCSGSARRGSLCVPPTPVGIMSSPIHSHEQAAASGLGFLPWREEAGEATSCLGRGRCVGWTEGSRERATCLPDTRSLQRGLRTAARSPGWTPDSVKLWPLLGRVGAWSRCTLPVPSTSTGRGSGPQLSPAVTSRTRCFCPLIALHRRLGTGPRTHCRSLTCGGHLPTLDPHPRHVPSRELSVCSWTHPSSCLDTESSPEARS